MAVLLMSKFFSILFEVVAVLMYLYDDIDNIDRVILMFKLFDLGVICGSIIDVEVFLNIIRSGCGIDVSL